MDKHQRTDLQPTGAEGTTKDQYEKDKEERKEQARKMGRAPDPDPELELELEEETTKVPDQYAHSESGPIQDIPATTTAVSSRGMAQSDPEHTRTEEKRKAEENDKPNKSSVHNERPRGVPTDRPTGLRERVEAWDIIIQDNHALRR